jgi:DNA-binding MarR family transcriptional regulator
VSGLTPNQWTILEALTEGPRWSRSFQTVKPLYEDLIARGLIERCRPHMGRGANQLRLTPAGCAVLEIEPAGVPARRIDPKPNSKAFKPVLGAILPNASAKTRATCEAFMHAIASGATSREAVADLAARYDVQRPAIWKRLRDGGVISPYASKRDGGQGRPLGGGQAGYTDRRRDKCAALAESRRIEPSPEQFVDRDSCPRCGVRADIGCRHSRAPIGMVF